MDRFPLSATDNYSYQQRWTLEHRGVDIMAPQGAVVYAVEDGTAWATVDPKGGNVVYLDGKSGKRYYYAHLDRWAAKLMVTSSPHVQVAAGDDLGYVGNTGNAAGGPPHVHFQVRMGSMVYDPFDDLQAVDPHKERGSRPMGALPAAGLLALIVLWAMMSK